MKQNVYQSKTISCCAKQNLNPGEMEIKNVLCSNKHLSHAAAAATQFFFEQDVSLYNRDVYLQTPALKN